LVAVSAFYRAAILSIDKIYNMQSRYFTTMFVMAAQGENFVDVPYHRAAGKKKTKGMPSMYLVFKGEKEF
jgi:hypothetical protein